MAKVNSSDFVRSLIKIIPHITPFIFEKLIAFIDDLDTKAQGTPNPYDNLFVALLRMLFL